ncbi:MAG: S24 family peptidase, partial [Treponema sp.]|nr:S24 family peptidase [Treponema sp.]
PITIDGEADHAVLVPEYLLRRGEEYYAATVRGSSMTERGIRDGDLVLIRVTNVPRSGAVQAVRYQDKVTLKLVRQTESGGWELRYKDGTKQVIACDTDEYEVLGEFEAVLPEDTPVVRI